MKITIKFDTANDAFCDDNFAFEVARIMRECETQVVKNEVDGFAYDAEPFGRFERSLSDVNGNKVGWLVVESR